jgi:hypothetical protein
MAHTLNVPTNEAIGLEECLDLLKALKQPDIAPGRGLSEAAIYLRKLANNREFLVDLVNAELNSLADLNRFQKNNGSRSRSSISAGRRISGCAPISGRRAPMKSRRRGRKACSPMTCRTITRPIS